MRINYAIVAAFQKLGDVNDWEYTGECYTIAGGRFFWERCVCGHTIKTVYVLQNRINGGKAKVGSTCIDHFREYSPELFVKLTAARAAQRKARKQRTTRHFIAPSSQAAAPAQAFFPFYGTMSAESTIQQ